MKQIKSIDILKQNKGAALIWVLIVFVVLSILLASVTFVSRQNIFEVAKQEERLQTYYIASAGIDLTYAALMELNKNNTRIEDDIINKIKNSAEEEKEVKQEIDVETNGKKRGTATVTIDRIEEEDVNWLRITSVGKLEGRETTVSSIMRINERNINQIVRER